MFHQNERAEFGLVVFEQELAVLQFDLCVAARDRDVIDPQVTLMASSKFEHIFLRAWSDDVDDPVVVLLLTQTFKHEIIANWLLILNQIVSSTTSLKHERVCVLADFAFK